MIRMLAILSAILVPTAAKADTVTIEALCRALTEHRPQPDVGFRQGLDVYGRPVAPADLEPTPLDLPQVLDMEIIVPLLEPLDLPVPGAYRGEVLAGFATLLPDGSVLFNGRPLVPSARERLLWLCAEAPHRR